MQAALKKIFEASKVGITDTQVEFGRLLDHAPIAIKLDEDPNPLDKDEIVILNKKIFTAEDIGIRLALLRCSNGQYLVLGEV